MRLDSVGHVYLEPGDECGFPVQSVIKVLHGLSRSDLMGVLSDVHTYHPEAFEEALLNHHRIMEKVRVRQAAAKSVSA